MSTVLVRYRIARTGEPVPSGTPPPPDYVPWPHAPIGWTRIEGDYAPGIVRPRDSLTTRADKHGEGAAHLSPGRYRITLPGRESYDCTVSADLPEIDLSALLAGGIEPDDPQYPTLLGLIEEALEPVPGAVQEATAAAERAEGAATDAEAAAQEARDAAQPLTEDREAAEAARDAAIEAQGLAESARDDAEGYATTAGTARDQAVQARTDAQDAAGEASQSALAAAGSASAAEGSASSAAGSASAAAGSATAAQTAQGHAEDARDAAQGYATTAGEYATTAGEHATQTGLDAAATAADRLAVSQDRQAIESEQAARLAAIEDAGDTQVGRVEGEGDTQVGRVEGEGDTQVALIEGAGQGRLVQADSVLGLSDLIAWDTLKGSGPLTGSVAPSGQVWQSTASQLERTELGLQQFVGGSQDHWLDIGTPDAMVTLDIATRTPSRQKLLLRYQDEADCLWVERSGASLRLMATVGGTTTQVLSVPDFGTTALSAWLRIRVALAQDVVRLWADDQYLGRVELTALQMAAIGAATRFGIRHTNTIGVCYRNFAVRRIAL